MVSRMKESKSQEKSHQQDGLADAARQTRRKIAFLLKKPIVRQQEVYRLAKTFFKAYLKHDYEFTMEELGHEIHKVYLSSVVRERVEALIEKLSLLEYTDTEYSQTELQLLLREIDDIIRDLVVEHHQEVPWLTRLANWLFRKRTKERQLVITEYPRVEAQDPVAIELNRLIESIYAALDEGKRRKAAREYALLLRKYNRLGKSVQELFFHTVNEAYKAISQVK